MGKQHSDNNNDVILVKLNKLTTVRLTKLITAAIPRCFGEI